MNIAFEIPGLRLKGGLNAREHWRARASRAAKERKLTRLFCREAITARWGHDWTVLDLLPMVITITRIGPRMLDDDNCAGSAKHCRDAIASDLGIDDGSPLVRWVYEQAKGRYGVRVTLAPKSRVEQRVVSA